MYPSRGWLFVVLTGFSRVWAESLGEELGNLLTSFLEDPTIISDLAPVETNPALLSTVESYFEGLVNIDNGVVPTAPPAFITALPSAAQNDLTLVFAEENSIISAKGGLSANGLSALTEGARVSTTTSGVNSTVTAKPQSQVTPGSETLTTVPSTNTISATTHPVTSSSGSAIMTAAASDIFRVSHIGMIMNILIVLGGFF